MNDEKVVVLKAKPEPEVPANKIHLKLKPLLITDEGVGTIQVAPADKIIMYKSDYEEVEGEEQYANV